MNGQFFLKEINDFASFNTGKGLTLPYFNITMSVAQPEILPA
jgi:hypothetical protein